MKPNASTCDPQRIALFLEQKLSNADQEAFESHLDVCDDCCRRLEATAAPQEVWTGVREFLQNRKVSSDDVPVSDADPTAEDASSNQATILKLLAPTDDDRMIGRWGTYEVVGVVGTGGMGVVLKAFDAALNRYVAIKILAPHLGSSGAARRRFSREAQASAAVVHDNVIEIYGVAEAAGLPYLVMPYVRGPSLQRRLDDEGPLAIVEILRVAMQAAAGLAAAHTQGLVHRDVKPANILLADGIERVKLTDFGLARAADDASLTRTGIIAGTPQYMSPEQARGEPVDQRSDLFSLGSVLYATCTGRPPFRAETTYGVLRRITDDDPRPIREINPETPEWLCGIVAKLMAKLPDDRFQSASEVSALLEQCLAHVQQPTVVPLPNVLISLRRDECITAERDEYDAGQPSGSPLPPGEGQGLRVAAVAHKLGPFAGWSGKKRIVATAIGLLFFGGLGLALGILIHLKKDNKTTTVEVPEGSTARVDAREGVTVELPSSPASSSIDGGKRTQPESATQNRTTSRAPVSSSAQGPASQLSTTPVSIFARGDAAARRNLEKALRLPVSLEFDNKKLSDVVDYLKESMNKKGYPVEIQLDLRAVKKAGIGPDRKITKTIRGDSLGIALRLMLNELQLTFAIRNGVLVITGTEQDENGLEDKLYPVTDLVIADPDGGVSAEPLMDLLLNAVVSKSWLENGGNGTMSALIMNDRLLLVVSQSHEAHEAIEKSLTSLRKAAGLKTDALPAAPAKRDAAKSGATQGVSATSDDETAERTIREALDQPVSLKIAKMTLKDAVDHVKGYLGTKGYHVEIQLDLPALKDEGIDPDQQLVPKSVAGISLRSALRLLLDDVELRYVIHNGMLVITTPVEAESDKYQETRFYRVWDLIVNDDGIADFQPLIEFLTNVAEPKSWIDNGGNGTISDDPTHGLLVISQSEQEHEAVEDCLDALRRAAGLKGESPAPRLPHIHFRRLNPATRNPAASAGTTDVRGETGTQPESGTQGSSIGHVPVASSETVAQYENAKTVTWKDTMYMHWKSKDGKRTWLQTCEFMEEAYKAPGRFRQVRLDDKGHVQDVEITDYVRGRKLIYWEKAGKKTATVEEIAPIAADEFHQPFSVEMSELKKGNLQWMGTRTTADRTVNVFRRRYPGRGGRPDHGEDYWIDAKTKQLVAVYNNTLAYDPDNDPLRNNQSNEHGFSGHVMGGRRHDIRFDVPLDDSLFSTEPPEGYAVDVKPPDHITEKEFIDYVGLVAEVNGKTFPDELNGPAIGDVYNRAERKPRKDRTAAEQRLYETEQRDAMRFSGKVLIYVFFDQIPDGVVKGSFRYLGKGVKLGDKDRIVFWYRLKNAKDPTIYRAVYGDLSVKYVRASDLPLPVQPAPPASADKAGRPAASTSGDDRR